MVFRIHQQPTRRMVGAVLAWLLLSMAAAVASPKVLPQDFSRVCSSAGQTTWVRSAGPGDTPDAGVIAGHGLECVLCLPLMAPPLIEARQHAVALPSDRPSATGPGRLCVPALWAWQPARAPPLSA